MMSKISRNDPCLCGSGQKYKNCCIDKVLKFPNPRSASEEGSKNPNEFLDLVKARFPQNQLGSIEEVNQELSRMMLSFNSMAQSSFLGLSPTQMKKILYTPFSFHNELFTFDCKDTDKFIKVPLFRHSLYLLDRLKNEGEIKATQTGNLPRALVRDMFHEFFSNDPYARLPNTEDDLLDVTRVKHILELSGLIKKRSNKYSLTKKGEELLHENKITELFDTVVLTFMNQWNWAFGDGYSELLLIQKSIVFNLYLLHKKCQNWISDKDLGQIYLEAFPNLVNEASGYFGPEKEIINCFSIRFLNRVCLPLGLLEYREEVVQNPYNRKEYYKVTRFFEDAFKFRH